MLWGFFGFVTQIHGQDGFTQVAIEKYFLNIEHQNEYVNLYGAMQRLLGKKQIEKFTIFKTEYDKLVAPRKELTEEDTKLKFEELYLIIAYLEENHIPYYYLTSLLPIQDKDLPAGVKDSSHTNQAAVEKELQEHNVTVIDLQELPGVQAIDHKNLFYRTDHHWRLETCFTFYQELIARIEEDLGFDLNSRKTGDKNNYSVLKQENAFLGSYGVKVGKYYDGKDDFLVFLPEFPTHFTFQSYDADGVLQLEKTGDFYEALLDDRILLDADYNNKYSAFCNSGYIENRILNQNAPNHLKCLYISHSYGRPLTMYLSLNFEEVVNLDPQKGRFNGNYIRYIEEFQPDVVLIQSEFEGEIIGEYRTSD